MKKILSDNITSTAEQPFKQGTWIHLQEGIAESLANNEVYFGDANLINTELAQYNKVTREEVLNVAKKYLNKDNRVVLYYLPKQKNN